MSESRFNLPFNPFERQVINPGDLSARAIPRFGEGGSVPPELAAAGQDVVDRVAHGIHRRTGKFYPIPFVAQVAAQQIVPEQPGRYYCFILNNSAANRLFVGFDYEPTATNGVVLEVNLGFYEPWIVPTNAIYIAAAAANTAGICIVAVES